MGCRVAAFVTLLVIIGVDLLTNIAAVPSPEHAAEALAERIAGAGRQRRAALEEDIVPVHRKLDLGYGDIYKFKPTWKGHLEAFAFQSPSDTRLSVKFESVDLHNYAEDTVTAYSGIVPNTELVKSKTTAVNDEIQRKEFRSQMVRLPLLFTTRDPSQTFQEHALVTINRAYFADANQMTVAFEHNALSKGFTALIEVHKVTQPDDTRGRRAELGGMPDPGSFSLCDAPDVISSRQAVTSNKDGVIGTITSHPSFPDEAMNKYNGRMDCKRSINLPSGRVKLEIIQMGLTTAEESCDTAYLEVTDSETGKSVKFCDSSHQGKTYEFSNRIDLKLVPGDWTWDVQGFSIIYSVLKGQKESSENEEDKNPTTSNDKKTAGPDISIFDQRKDIPKAEPISDLETTADTSADTIKTAGKKQNNAAQPLPAIFIISVIVVAILLIIILSAAGAIACYRTHQQDQIINSLTGRLIVDSSENGTSFAPDGSNNSLCQNGCQMNGSMYKSGAADGSITGIVLPGATGIDIARSSVKSKAKAYKPSDETARLLSSSPSGSHDTTNLDNSDSSLSPADGHPPSQPKPETCPVNYAEGSDYVITIDRAAD